MIDEPTHPGDRVGRELDRLVLRLATLGPARLDRHGIGGASPADQVRDVLTQLADAAADAEGHPRRPVPVLAAHALGDQLVVLVRDLRSVADEPVLTELAERLTALRRVL